MPQLPNRQEIQTLLSALLLSRKEAFTVGVPLAKLDQDYKEQEGMRIPFRQLGHACLLDLLQSLEGGLTIKYRDGMYHAYPVVTEKTKHVGSLVAGQNSRKMIRGRRRAFRPSSCFPQVLPPPFRLDSVTLANIVKFVKSNPDGVHMDKVIEFARDTIKYDIDSFDLIQQLRNISHEIIIKNDFLYSVSIYQKQKPRYGDVRTNGERQAIPPSSSSSVFNANEKLADMRNTGQSHSEFEEGEDDNFTFDVHRSRSDRNKSHESNARTNGGGNINVSEQFTDSKTPDKKTPDASSMKFDDENNEMGENETIAALINERTRIRLQKLIDKHPDGIWCADLPELYHKEYTIPLNYEELGFNSVIDYASHLPEIFHYARLCDKGDFKLFNAKATRPNIIPGDRPKVPSLASLHNIYEQYVEETEAIPKILSKLTIERLIPDGVMTVGEKVAHICVTELDRGTGENIDVVVSDVFTPSFFWIQLLNRVSKFNKFMEDLHHFYEIHAKKYSLPIAVMEKGLNCACVYDEKWHRGVIKTVRPDNYVTVLFYDYGTVKSYPAESIYFLHRSFTNLPAQAIACGLYNVKPVTGNRWSWGVACEFVNKATNVALIATIASIDTENNSMLVGLTNTEGEEDFHINDWLVQSGMAVYGKMGDTVNMNDTIDNVQRMDQTIHESSQGQAAYGKIMDEASPELGSVSFINETGTNPATEFMMLSIRKIVLELEYLVKNRKMATPAVLEGLQYIINLINTQFSLDSRDDKRQISPTDLLSVEIIDRNDVTTNNEKTVDESFGNRENHSSSMAERKIDANANIPEMILIDYTSDSDGIHDHDKNSNVERRISNVTSTANAFSNTFENKPSAPQKSSDYLQDLMGLQLSPRSKFENTLSESAKNFFTRIEASSTIEKSSNNTFHDTNPFRYDLSERIAPSVPERTSPVRRHESNNTETVNIVNQSRVTYESPPIIYDNVIREFSWDKRNNEIPKITREREMDLEDKKSNVKSWIENGHISRNHTADYSSPSSMLSGTVTGSNATLNNEINCNGTKFFADNSLDLSKSVTPSEWFDAIENSIGFKTRKDSSRNESNSYINDSAMQNDENHRGLCNTPDTIIEESLTNEDSAKTLLETNVSEERMKRKNSCVEAIQLTDRQIFLIIHENDGWVAVEEFASAFTNKPTGSMLQILEIQRVKIPFLNISRFDNSSLFDELDRSSINVPRDHNNKVGNNLNLVPLKSLLKILRKLKMITQGQVETAMRDKKFPGDSSVLFDVYKLINTWGEIKQTLALTK